MAEANGAPPNGKRWFTTPRAFEARLEDGWVLFAPDHRGLPMVVDAFTHGLLHAFDGGADPYAVIRATATDPETGAAPEETVALVRLLRARGFLRDTPTPDRYQIVPPLPVRQRALAVWFHITNHCNLDCPYCFVDKSAREMTRDDALQAVARIADTARTNRAERVVLRFGGGEPTLAMPLVEEVHDELRRLLEEAGIQMATAILSNGTHASPRLIEFLRRPGVTLGISLDGYADAHDRSRVFTESRKGSWDLIAENIRRFKENGITPRILTTVSPNSCGSLPDLVGWVFGNGLTMRLGVVRDSRPGESAMGRTGEEREQFILALNDAVDRSLIRLEDPALDFDPFDGLEIADLHMDAPAFGVRCGVGSNYIVVNELGRLAPCPMQAHEGSVAPGPDVLTTIRSSFAFPSFERKGDAEDLCLSCRWFPVCVSGCPIHNRSAHGSSFARSPYCAYYSQVIPRYIALFGRKLAQSARRQGMEDFRALTRDPTAGVRTSKETAP